MNRRDFIKTSGACAFALSAAGRALGAGAPSNRVRLAIVGCGRSSDRGKGFVFDPNGGRGRGYQIMCRAAELKDCEVAAVCDVDANARAYAASEVKRIGGNEPRQYRDVRDLMADPTIDGVIVATPDHWHVLAGIWAMKAGKALFLEKPIGVTAGEAEVLWDVQRATGAVFQLGTQRRSSYSTQQLVKAIHSGKYGKARWAKSWCLSNRPPLRGVRPAPVPEWLDWDLWQGPAPRRDYRSRIVHYNWRFIRGYGTGDLPNNGLHFVDIGRWALGADWPETVYAGGGHLFYEGEDFEFEDTHMLNVKFPGNRFLTWEGNSHTGSMPFKDKWTGCLVYCEDALGYFGPAGESALYDRKGKKLISEWSAGAVDPMAQVGESRLSNPTQACDSVHMRRFVDCVRNKSHDTAMTITEAVKSNLLTECGNVSLQTGEVVRINSATGRLADPKCAAARYWTREYEPGWEVKA